MKPLSRHQCGLLIATFLITHQSVLAASPDDRYGVSDVDIIYLEQNWTPDESLAFYSIQQGSPLVREDVFNSLEQPGGDGSLNDSTYLAKFGFLRQQRHDQNPSGLPVGFVTHNGAVEINCAACHTSRITFQGKEYRIDGSQAMADVESWLAELTLAMKLTLDDAPTEESWNSLGSGDVIMLDESTRFGRFAKRILKQPSPKAAQAYSVLEVLRADYERRQRYEDFNLFGKLVTSADERGSLAKHPAYGYGRIDALGSILNQATAEAIACPQNARIADAPVNYPAIWDAPQHTRVQWNGAVENEGMGALGRNVGQVVGVFGLVDASQKSLGGYESSVNIHALRTAEKLITKLWSPPWPTEFGVDASRVEGGRQVYQASCVSCHALMERDDPNRLPNDALTPIEATAGGETGLNTDRKAAENWSRRVAEVGPLAGRFRSYPLGARFPAEASDEVPARDILSHVVFNVLTRTLVPWRDELTLDTASQPVFLLSPSVSADKWMRYKSRPLNGVWSTSPYLHNGSVLNIEELLKPSHARKQTFRIGTTEYDPDTLGYRDEGSFVFDTSVPGNSNSGHEYGTELTPDQKRALLEFLKTL